MREIVWRTYGVTDITPLSAVLVVSVGVLIFFLPKRYVLPAMLLPALCISEFQRVVVADMDFNIMRILVIFGWLRLLLINDPIHLLKLNAIDITFLLWTVMSIITYSLLRQSFSAVMYQAGESFQTLGLFFMFRLYIRDLNDINLILKGLVIISIGIAAMMMMEFMTQSNMFSILGAEQPFYRKGNLRCMGPFNHPILAGTFGASLIPVSIAIWWQERGNRMLSILGIIAGLIIIITSSSSGPIMAFIAVVIAFSLWPLRKYIALLCWGIVLGLVALDVIMKDPVWYIITKFTFVSGSTAYHRAHLIDAAVNNFEEWALWGTRTTAHWGWGLQDTTNQFIREGIDGGVLTLLLFILIIFFCFQTIGRLMPFIESQTIKVRIIFWAMGVALLSHVVSFMNVSYFDQVLFWWYLLLASISISRDFLHKLEIRMPFSRVEYWSTKLKTA